MSFAFPALVANIGGADARLSLNERPPAEPCAPAHVRSGDYPRPADAIAPSCRSSPSAWNWRSPAAPGRALETDVKTKADP
jgi:glucokinase